MEPGFFTLTCAFHITQRIERRIDAFSNTLSFFSVRMALSRTAGEVIASINRSAVTRVEQMFENRRRRRLSLNIRMGQHFAQG